MIAEPNKLRNVYSIRSHHPKAVFFIVVILEIGCLVFVPIWLITFGLFRIYFNTVNRVSMSNMMSKYDQVNTFESVPY